MSHIVILGWIDFEPGDRDLWLDNAPALIRATRLEPGCLRHVIVADPDWDTAVITHAHYASEEAFAQHMASEHFQEFRLQTEAARMRDRNVVRFEATPVS